ncbi:MAG: hypothetical protein GY756_23955, partial [bacterium]|nr:hypothetical protein [bacterium]
MKRFLIPLIIVMVLFGYCFTIFSASNDCASDSVYFNTLVGEEWKFTLKEGSSIIRIDYLEFGTSLESCISSNNCTDMNSNDGCAYLHTEARNYSLGRIFFKKPINTDIDTNNRAYVAEIVNADSTNSRRCYNFALSDNGGEGSGKYYEIDIYNGASSTPTEIKTIEAIRVGADGGDEESCFIKSLTTINFMTII